MSDLLHLVADKRDEFGKGAARRLRRDGRIPAVLYGHGTDPVHLSVPAHQTTLALKHANALFTLTVAGDETLALAKAVQRDPVRQIIEHIDFLIVKKGEKVQVDIPVVVVGEPAPGAIHLLEAQTLPVEADATAIPDSIEVDIDGLEAGNHVSAGQLKLPAGVTLAVEPEHVVVSITEPRGTAEDEAEEAAAQEAAADAAAEA